MSHAMNAESFRQSLAVIDESALLAVVKPASLRAYPRNAREDDWGISTYYAPFDSVNQKAKIVLIGITPGESQMHRAWVAARTAMSRGADISSAISEVKRQASFNDKKGQMRPNLYAQLEHWGVHRWLGFPSASGIFEEGWSAVHTTSLLCFPTFLKGKNYEGKSPPMLKHPFLRSLVFDRLVPELQSIPQAVLLPLGSTVEAVVKELYSKGLIKNPCVFGMLHPSGQNTYRLNYLCGDRSGPTPHLTNVGAYDAGRKSFRATYLLDALSQETPIK